MSTEELAERNQNFYTEYKNGLSVEEISKLFNVSEATVRKNITLSKKMEKLNG